MQYAAMQHQVVSLPVWLDNAVQKTANVAGAHSNLKPCVLSSLSFLLTFLPPFFLP